MEVEAKSAASAPRTFSRRETRRQKKSQQILDAARRLFIARGYGSTSMDAVAQEAKVGKATLYAIFSSKEDLFAEVIKAEGEFPSRSIPAEPKEMDTRAALSAFAHDFLDLQLSAENIAVYRSIASEGARFKELGFVFYHSGPQVMLSKLDAFLARAMDRGILRKSDSRVAASQFIGLIRGDLQTKALLGFEPSQLMDERDRVVDSGLDVFWRAYAIAPKPRRKTTATEDSSPAG